MRGLYLKQFRFHVLQAFMHELCLEQSPWNLQACIDVRGDQKVEPMFRHPLESACVSSQSPDAFRR